MEAVACCTSSPTFRPVSISNALPPAQADACQSGCRASMTKQAQRSVVSSALTPSFRDRTGEVYSLQPCGIRASPHRAAPIHQPSRSQARGLIARKGDIAYRIELGRTHCERALQHAHALDSPTDTRRASRNRVQVLPQLRIQLPVVACFVRPACRLAPHVARAPSPGCLWQGSTNGSSLTARARTCLSVPLPASPHAGDLSDLD
ncbi:hypothetical protein C8Q80DRAFT_939685 [Daedaleopsis nitida]|nr:hypothetical protein C8Q80DRAFT_939685 [Daedaleopsis nitida]